MSGWIKLHRVLLNSVVMQDDWHFRLFVWCLLKANRTPYVFKGQTIGAGQFVTGRITGSEELKVSPSKFYRGLQTLSDKYKSISLKANSGWTTVTICNWSTYQARDDEERTASEQPVIQPADSKRTAGDTTTEHNPRIQEFNSSLYGDHFSDSTNGGTFLTAPDDNFGKWWDCLPDGMRSGRKACWSIWPAVLLDIQSTRGCDEAAAVQYLIRQTVQFAKSPKGRTHEFRWSPQTFLKDGHYDDDVRAWEVTKDECGKQQPRAAGSVRGSTSGSDAHRLASEALATHGGANAARLASTATP